MNKPIIYLSTAIGVLTITLIVVAGGKRSKNTKKQNAESKANANKSNSGGGNSGGGGSSGGGSSTAPISLDKNAIGKKVYTKNADTNIRTSRKINNGVINNIYGTVKAANTYLGTVGIVEKVENKGFWGVELYDTNPATGKPWMWAGLKLDNAILKQLGKSNMPQANEVWIREDVLILK
jgi:hypothetical protein